MLVAAVGALTWLAGRSIATAREPGVLQNGRLAVLLGGGLAVLVAAALTSGWWLRVPAVAALLAVVWAGTFAFRDTGPSDLDVRLDHAGLERSDLRVLTIAGYHPVDPSFGMNENGDEYVPNSPGAAGRINLKVIEVTAGCRPPRCTDPGYLLSVPVYPKSFDGDLPRAAVLENGRVYELTGDLGVDPGLLRNALRTLRTPRDEEIAAGLPPFSPRNPAEALRHWLRDHT